MKNRSLMAIIISLSLCLSVLYPVALPLKSGSAAVKLSATSMKIPAKKSKVLKMLNTSRKVTWSVKSGKNLITLKNKKKNSVKIVAKKKGTAVVKAVIRYSSKNIRTYTCKVKVTNSQWECPGCGFVNTSNFCQNCGHARPTPSPTPWLVWPTQTPVVSGSPGPSASTSPTPVPAEAMTQDKIVMCINETHWFEVQMYANSAAQAFLKRVKDTYPNWVTCDMGPDGEDEIAGVLLSPIAYDASANSKINKVSAGEILMYGSDFMKIAIRDHEATTPARVGMISSYHLSDLEPATQTRIDGKITVKFKWKMD